MSGNSIYVIKKGQERVTLPDNKSAQDLMYALNVLDCFEPVSKQMINGNKMDLELYEICFLDKAIKVVGLTDAERVLHWMMIYGCRKVTVEKLSQENEDDKNNGI